MPPLLRLPEEPVQALTPFDARMKRRDAMLMRAALFQARGGLGRTWPNPSVGAVIAHPGTGEIIASAVTAPGGRPHAEVIALEEAGARASGAVMVTTLEPCAHHGLTPPCVDAIQAAGISELLYGGLDPDPRVSGAGAARLLAAGVRVRPAPFAEEAEWLNIGHVLRHSEGRPFVQLKLAVDADGLVAAGVGAPVWVTGKEARTRTHLLRAEADAILVGRTTILHDDPLLTCRLPGLEQRSPVRIVLTGEGAIPPKARLLNGEGPPVWIVAGEQTPPHIREQLERAGARLFLIPSAQGEPERLPVRAVLAALTQAGVTRLLVEGGPTVARAFFHADVVDEAIIFQGRQRMPAAAIRLRPFGTDGLALLTGSPRYQVVDVSQAGDATMSAYRRLPLAGA